LSSVPAIILARSGSKGVANKNKRTLAGFPCWMWTALDAYNAGLRVIVSSDDPEIIETAVTVQPFKVNGPTFNDRTRIDPCEVVLRPSELASDTATVQDSVRHACRAKGIDHGPVVVLYGCVPVRPKWLISSALAVLEATEADSVQSYAPVGKCHPAWLAWVAENGEVFDYSTWTAGDRPHRRQDLPPVYAPDGGVIVVRDPEVFFGDNRQSVTTQPGDVIDIDTERDAMLAECVLRDRIALAKAERLVNA
jgi:CMP-N-acetylneuraminic acid synthetase